MTEPKHAPPGLNVLVVGDDPVLRQGVAQYLSVTLSSVTVSETSSALEGLEKAGAAALDLIVLDLAATGGLAPLIKLKLAIPDVPVLVLYSDPTTTNATAAFAAGAAGYLGKGRAVTDWHAAIETVVRGGNYPAVQ